MARGAFLKDLGRLVEARNDLEAVLASEELFPGSAPSALVELGELARLEHDAKRARQYIEMASVSSDIDAPTLVETLIVYARLLTDEGDAVGAESIWQSVLTNPNASVRQKSIAANRGAAST
jgi:Flp pilus assembly protein TadD